METCVLLTGLFSCKSKSLSYERFRCTKTRFETEAQGNSEMCYLLTHGRNVKGEEGVGRSLRGGVKGNFEGKGNHWKPFNATECSFVTA